ncbi:MAG: hypothetical protein U0350_46975 [Caldilineaceae bacterium]
MLNNKTENAIKLCVIAALTDGWTNEKELTIAVSGIADKFGEDAADVSDYTLRLVDEYMDKRFNQDKTSAAIAAIEALRSLGLGGDATDARSALAVARAVVRADDWENCGEHNFLGLLSQLLGIESD